MIFACRTTFAGRPFFAHFHFVTPPQASKVTFNWRKPGNPKVRFTGYAVKPYAETVDTFVCEKYSRSGSCVLSVKQQLRVGKWYCILYAAGRVVKRQRVIVT